MSAALFDLALRVTARRENRPVARMVYSPVATRPCRVAIAARRAGRQVSVEIATATGRVYKGSGQAALTAIRNAANEANGGLWTGATALVDSAETLHALGALASRFTDPARCSDSTVAEGAALAGWWVERAEHPGTSAVVNLVAASRQRFVLGVAPGEDSAALWRSALAVPNGLAGLHQWCNTITQGQPLPGLSAISDDDNWLLGVYREAVCAGRAWDGRESLRLAAARLASRCDAADVYTAALLFDPLVRAREVHNGFVCHGEVVVGSTQQGRRIQVRAPRLDTRLKEGSAVIGWPGDPMSATPGLSHRFSGEVLATSVADGELVVSLGGLTRTDYLPAAGERVTVIPAPPSVSLIRMRRTSVASLYRQRFSWLSQGATPQAARRSVPLAVLIAAADEEPAPSASPPASA